MLLRPRNIISYFSENAEIIYSTPGRNVILNDSFPLFCVAGITAFGATTVYINIYLTLQQFT